MKRPIFMAVVLVSVLLGLTLGGCNKDETTSPTTQSPIRAISNLRAYSVSATQVGLKWTPSADAGQNGFDSYRIVARLVSGTDSTVTTAVPAADSVRVAGLTNGVIYNFEVTAIAATGSSTFTNSSTVSIRWSPASRYENESGQPAPIQVYESSSSTGFASGMVFFSSSVAGPKTVSLLSSDSSAIDVWVKTEANSAVSLNSSHIYRANRKITRFNLITRDANTLNDPQIAPPDTTAYNNFSILIDSATVASGKIVYFKGNDGNYGRILVQRNPSTNRLIWGTSPEQYLSLAISYQSVAFNPYAKPIKINATGQRSAQ
jgi:hypothetical protein